MQKSKIPRLAVAPVAMVGSIFVESSLALPQVQISPFFAKQACPEQGRMEPIYSLCVLRPFDFAQDKDAYCERNLKKQSQFENTQMNVSSVKTTNYEQIIMNNKQKNKPNQTQYKDRRQMSEDGGQMTEYLAPKFIAGLPVGWVTGGEQQRLAPQFIGGLSPAETENG